MVGSIAFVVRLKYREEKAKNGTQPGQKRKLGRRSDEVAVVLGKRVENHCAMKA